LEHPVTIHNRIRIIKNDNAGMLQIELRMKPF
jgi:hypothetical protein